MYTGVVWALLTSALSTLYGRLKKRWPYGEGRRDEGEREGGREGGTEGGRARREGLWEGARREGWREGGRERGIRVCTLSMQNDVLGSEVSESAVSRARFPAPVQCRLPSPLSPPLSPESLPVHPEPLHLLGWS